MTWQSELDAITETIHSTKYIEAKLVTEVINEFLSSKIAEIEAAEVECHDSRSKEFHFNRGLSKAVSLLKGEK